MSYITEDHENGLLSIEKQENNTNIIYVTKDPEEVFKSDPIKMIRTIRIAIKYSSDLRKDTFDAIKKYSGLIKSATKQQVSDELIKIFTSGRVDQAFYLLNRTNIWHVLSDTTYANNRTGWDIMVGLANIQANDPLVFTLAIFLHSTYKCSKISDHYLNEMLVLTDEQKSDIDKFIKCIYTMRNFGFSSLPDQRKMLQWDNIELIERYLDRMLDSDHRYYLHVDMTLDSIKAKKEEVRALGWPTFKITKEDISEMGFISHPIHNVILESILDEQLEGRLISKDEIKPFILSKYPAIPRKLDNGKIYNGMLTRRVVAQCSKCKNPMYCTVERDYKGNIIWDTAKDKIGIRRYPSKSFIHCSNCYGGKRAKTKFVDMKD